MRVYTRIMDMDTCICTGLRQAAFDITEIYDSYLEPSGLKITMFRVLRRLSSAEQASITELAVIVGVDRSTLGRNLRVLERMNLVAFEEAEDARSRTIVLTALGRTTLAKATPLWVKAQTKMRSVLGEELKSVFVAMTKVKHAAEAQ
ncbi:DNA-binding MarR family transcriptional regulator [Afipia massiliensis]|uniref:DNA-binding MarR family transcriptional regulator n=2 Tax=Afipia massiliensis TaxID=211460 RepID=A0A840N959_9BRAD|nr:DNA-binding MarR family transcriptional regulator [Afipia massiliensis]